MTRPKNTAVSELVSDVQLSDDLQQNLNAMTEHRTRIMAQFGDGLVYDRNRVVHETRFYMAQSAEAMLEAGKRLVILKENEPYGDFTDILESELGLAPQVARRMMQASLKFLGSQDTATKRSALSVLGKTKLYELMMLDDDELDALADGGTIAGATLDDIDRMTSRELRTALRTAREDADAQSRLISGKDQKINDLSVRLEKKSRIKPPAPDAEAAMLRREVSAVAFEAEAVITGRLGEAFTVLVTYCSGHQADPPYDFMTGLLCQIERAINQLRHLFDLSASPTGSERPEWLDAVTGTGNHD